MRSSAPDPRLRDPLLDRTGRPAHGRPRRCGRRRHRRGARGDGCASWTATCSTRRESSPSSSSAPGDGDVGSSWIASRYREPTARTGSRRARTRGVSSLVARRRCSARSFPSGSRDVTDPMSGFFLVDETSVDARRLRPAGFKILLEILGQPPGAARRPRCRSSSARVTRARARRRRGAGRRVRAPAGRVCGCAEPGRRDVRLYDIHGLVGVESERAAARARGVPRRAFARRGPTISVRVAGSSRSAPAASPIDLTADVPDGERTGAHGLRHRRRGRRPATGRRCTVSPFVAPLAARALHERRRADPALEVRRAGYALVHAACFADGDDAFLITARTDTGKTTTMLKVLDAHPTSGSSSDDLAIVSPDGDGAVVPEAADDQRAHACTPSRTPMLTAARAARADPAEPAALPRGTAVRVPAHQVPAARREHQRARCSW